MQKLVQGLHKFQRDYFATHQQLFQQLARRGQRPETLCISCCDSRVIPTLITNAEPGELFIVRNIGNMVPQISLAGGTAAAIEYAVSVLQVENVIICGHTQCGAMDAVLRPETVEGLPFVRRWVEQAKGVKEIIQQKYAHLDGAAQLTAAAQENVLAQLENLRAFRCVQERLDAGKLLVSGWVFHIEKGMVFDYDPERGEFAPLPSPGVSRDADQPAAAP